jgi:hypothetical protein
MSWSLFIFIAHSLLQVRKFFVTKSTKSANFWFLRIKLVIPSVLDWDRWFVNLLIILPLKVFINALVHRIVSWDFRTLRINRASQISVPKLVNNHHIVRNLLFFFLFNLVNCLFLDMDLFITSWWCIYFTWISHYNKFFFLDFLNWLQP